MKRLDEIFDVWYGVNLEVVNNEVVEKGVPFVSRQSVNNGIVCHIKRIPDVAPNPANTLSIAVSGSVLSTFYHDYEYYSGRDVYVAKPKIALTVAEMLYYCYIIEHNKYRYNYGRGANKTFRSILVPSRDEIPNEIKSRKVKSNFKRKPLSFKKLELKTKDWKWFRVGEIFDCNTTKHAIQQELSFGEMPFVTRSAENNGVSGYVEATNCIINKSNCITIGAEGIFAFYQPNDFVTGVKVYTLRQISLNPYNAIFICTLLNKEVYRYNYGNARILEKIKREKLKLPAIKNAKGEYEPDWQWMEDYIKGLPYSGCL